MNHSCTQRCPDNDDGIKQLFIYRNFWVLTSWRKIYLQPLVPATAQLYYYYYYCSRQKNSAKANPDRQGCSRRWLVPSLNISSPPPRLPEYLSDHRTLAQVPTPQQYLFREGKTREGKTREFSIARKTPRCRSEDYSANLQKLSSLRGKHGPRESLRRDFGLTLNRVLLNNYDSLRENRQGHEPPTVSVRESPSGEITIMVRVRSLTGVFATIVQRGI